MLPRTDWIPCQVEQLPKLEAWIIAWMGADFLIAYGDGTTEIVERNYVRINMEGFVK